MWYLEDNHRVFSLLINFDLRETFLIKLTIFLIILPYNLAVIALIVAVCAIPAIMLVPLMIIPSYFLNIRKYYRVLKYWWSGNRFDGDGKSSPNSDKI
jgi:hypothetical protein